LKFTTYERFKFLRGGKINSILDEIVLLGLLMMLNSVSVTVFLAKFIGFILPLCNRPKFKDKGNKIVVDTCVTTPKFKYVPPRRRQTSQKYVPTCHHYDKVSHIRPKRFLLKPSTVVVSPSPRKLDKGKRVLELVGPKIVGQAKKVWIPLKSKVEGVNPPRRQSSWRILFAL